MNGSIKIRDTYLVHTKTFVESAGLTFRGSWFSCTVNNRIILLIPRGFYPQKTEGALFTQVQLPAGSSAARSDEVSKDIEARLLKIPGIKDTIALVGLNGENTAFIVSNLELWSKRKRKKYLLTGL